MPTTQSLFAREDLFDVHDPERPVSSASRLGDLVWRLDSQDPAYPDAGITVGWRAEAAAEGPISENEARLTLDMQRLAWLCLVDPAVSEVCKPATLRPVAQGCRALVRFMIERGLRTFSDLTPDVAEDYARWVADELRRSAARREVEEISYGNALMLLTPLSLLWKARRHLSASNVPVPIENPLRTRTAYSVAKEIGDLAADTLPAIPEEIFRRIVNAACDVLLVHADDVLRAQQVWFEQTGGIGVGDDRHVAMQRLADLAMPSSGRSATWWPRSLCDPKIATRGSATGGLKHLIDALRDACAIIVLATSGLRVGELLAAPGGRSIDGMLPLCLRTRRSEDGLIETFSLSSTLFKRQVVPLETDWLVGSRPTNVGPLPLGALALDVLERLMAPWAALAGDARSRASLLVKFHSERGLPRSGGSITRMTSTNLSHSIRRFYSTFLRFDDLPDRSSDMKGTDLRELAETRGAHLLVQQYRTTYVQTLMRIDSGLLPAIRSQLKHMRMATTQMHYAGNDPRVLGSADSEQRREAGATLSSFLGFVDGAMSGHGRLADLIDRSTASPAATTTRGEQPISAEELAGLGIGLIPCDHGYCGIQLAPHLSRCNQIAGNASFLSLKPDERHRSPTTCLGCRLFGVNTTHLAFWQRYHDVNRDIWEAAKKAGACDDYRVAKARMKRAAAILKLISGDKKP